MEQQLNEAWSKMIDKLEGWGDLLVMNLPNLVLAVIVFVLSILISRYFKKLILKLLNKTEMRNAMKNLMAQIASVAVVLVGLFLVLGILNLSKTLNAMLAGAGVAGLAVGLALQGTLANTFSGIVISYVKQIKYGDWIQTNSYSGEVIDLDLRAVTLKQADNNIVYIPNKMVVENPIKNFTITTQSKVMLDCGVGYESDLEQVKELAIETIKANFSGVENDDDVIFLFTEFGDSAINFQIRFWIDSTSGLEVAKAKSKAIMAIKQAFDAKKINIPFPIRTLDLPENIKISSS